MKRKLLTEPQYRLLKWLDGCEGGETRLAGARDCAVARRLKERYGCTQWSGEHFWRITDHGRNILDLHRSFFEPAPQPKETP